MAERYVNNFKTTLTAGITTGAVAINVAAAAPEALWYGQFRVVVDSEIMLVTGGAATTTWDVTRAIEGSTIAAHSIGRPVAHVLTVASLQQASGVFDVRMYGAVGDGTTDDTDAIQDAITAAFEAPGGIVQFPPGEYLVSSTLTTPVDTAGAVALVGMGRNRSWPGGVSGDPWGVQGVQITYTGMTGDIFLADVSGGNVRQYLTLENIFFMGNGQTIGSAGHGLHFKAAVGTSAVIMEMRDVTVSFAPEHGIFFDGNIFESTLHNVRSNNHGGAGLKGAANTGGLPGQNALYGGYYSGNAVGIDLDGGGGWALYSVVMNSNVGEGLVTQSVALDAFNLSLEVNNPGDLTGAQAIFNGGSPSIHGIGITANGSATGAGLKLVGCNWARIVRFSSNSSVTAAGYADIEIDFASSRCTILDYGNDDFVDRLDLSAANRGHVVTRGTESLTSQAVPVQRKTGAGNFDADCTKYNSFYWTKTVAETVQFGFPVTGADGQRVTLVIYNNSGGVTGTNWGWDIMLAGGSWTDPANTKSRSVSFEYDATRARWIEISRTDADV